MHRRHSRQDETPDPGSKIFTALLAILLCMCWLQGGVVDDAGPADEWLQLLAVPLVVLGIWRISARPLHRPTGWGLGVALAIVLVPLLQLLPLPWPLAMVGNAREVLSTDLEAAGVTPSVARASLSLLASERALWSLTPALALFLGALSLPSSLRRRLLQLTLGLVLASAAFGFQQMALPDDSPELLYTKWGRNFGGFFINPNHQGTALVIGTIIAAALFIEGLRSPHKGATRHLHWAYALLCTSCVLMLPLARGTAAAMLVLPGLLACLFLLGAIPNRLARHPSLPKVYTVGLGALAVAVLGLGVMMRHVDVERGTMAAQTARIGMEYAPLGSGIGTFVPVYLQEQDLRMAQTKTINHAHDEYVQWWLEGGLPALLVVGFGLALFGWAGWYILARMTSRRARALAAPAWACLLILLLHSVVDFPMRTTTLMATAGLFAGVLLGAIGAPTQESSARRRSEGASQRA